MALTYLVAVSSSSSFVTIHAQWANPPWLTRLTLCPSAPASVLSSSVHSSPPKRSLRSSADTITQSANDDDDSLLLNLTPLNCRSVGPPRTRFRLGHKLRSELFQSMGRPATPTAAAPSPSQTHTRHKTRRERERRRKSFSLFPPPPVCCFGQTRVVIRARRSSRSRLDSGTEMLAAAANPITYAVESGGRGRAPTACLSILGTGRRCLSTHGAPGRGRALARRPQNGSDRAPVVFGGAEAACATNTVTSHNAAAAAATRSFF